MIEALTYFSGICGTKFSKKEVFSKNRGLAAFVQTTAWQAAASPLHVHR
jgi:hypothetical protein